MEQATLRPVPLRPAGPVDPADAAAHVARALPELPADAARALSLIEIAGRTRDRAADEMGVSADSLAELLYAARKALRRSIFPLSASGWCERAEQLLSERIDGVLVPPGPARLDVHLRNCERCVEHERRLSQAREKLVREFIDAHPHAPQAGPADRPAAALRVVEPAAVAETEGPTRTVAGFAGAIVEPESAEVPEPSFAGPGGQAEIREDLAAADAVEPRVAEPLEAHVAEPPETDLAEEPRVPDADELPADPPLDDDIRPAEPADTSPSEHDAEDAQPPVEESEPAAQLEPLEDPAEVVAPVVALALNPSTLVWGSLTLLSVSLAVFAMVVLVLALSGVDRIF